MIEARNAAAASATETSLPTRLDGILESGSWRGSSRNRQDHLNCRAATGFTIQKQPAIQPIGYDVVDDVQTKPGAAHIAPCREEGVESLSADVIGHATPVVGKPDFNMFLPEFMDLDADGACTIRKCVCYGIEEQVGQQLPIRSRKTVHREIGLTSYSQLDHSPLQTRPQTLHNLRRQLTDIEAGSLMIASVGCDLLEGSDQFGRAREVSDQL